MTRLFLRADASARIGSGHVMRCLSIGEAWQESGGQVCFGMAVGGPVLGGRLAACDMELTLIAAEPGSAADARQTAAAARDCGAEWIVVDGYHFGAEYQHLLKESGFRLLAVDDFGQVDHYWADLVLNQNIFAEERTYDSREMYTTLLLGPRYVQLRREFRKWQGWRRTPDPKGRKVLISLGGVDADNVSLKILQGLAEIGLDDLQILLALGAGSPHGEVLNLFAAQIRRNTPPPSVEIVRDVRDMAHPMAWADTAVTAGGTTTWEAAFMGLPSLIIVLAENQVPVAQGLAANGIAVNMGWHTEVTPPDIGRSLAMLLGDSTRRMMMSRAGQATVDGEGAMRLLMHFEDRAVRLRTVRMEDCELVWRWANEPSARAVSFSDELIPWDEHVAWFERKVSDPACLFFIAVNRAEEPVGQVRCELQDGEATLSINIDIRFRGRGLGRDIVRLATRQAFTCLGVSKIRALVQRGHTASETVFTKAGFVKDGTVIVRGKSATVYALPLDRHGVRMTGDDML